jgi:hypothetical protein
MGLVLSGTLACRQKSRRSTPAPEPAAAATPLPLPQAEIMPGVLAPRLTAKALGASIRQQAIESIGTYEWKNPADPDSALVSTNGDYWTHLADLAWHRDIEIHLDDVPVDLDQDGTVDTKVTRHISLKGGILGNPEAMGLAPDPDEPAGTRVYTSASTGFAGLRDALDLTTGEPTGTIGMTCWLCHSGKNPVDGKTYLGLPSAPLDYGLMLATSSLFNPTHVLDLDGDGTSDRVEDLRRRMGLRDSIDLDPDKDGRVLVAEYRAALKLPEAKVVQARLLLAGPGRADLTNEFGLDMTTPGIHSRRYAEVGSMRTGDSGVFNPKSIPSALAVRQLSVINWAANYATRGTDWLGRYAERTGQTRAQALADLDIDFPPGLAGDRDLINRAMVLDGRSIGAIGLQADSFIGIYYVRALRHERPASPALVRGMRLGFEATAIRKLLYGTDLSAIARPTLDAERVRRGRELFENRIMGEIRNQQILMDVPPAYSGLAISPPLLAPIDETKPDTARIPVRCISCHSATTLATLAPIPQTGLAIQRCTDCHRAHAPQGILARLGLRSGESNLGMVPIPEEFGLDGLRATAKDIESTCRRCHDQHPVLATPIPYSNCMIFPFDADGDGRAQNDEWEDLAAGGIGTDSLFGFEVDRRQLSDKNVRMPITKIPSMLRPEKAETVNIAGPWVRTPPLTTLLASAPYLHNGSVPTLQGLLEPSARRPPTFKVGQGAAAFSFDTRLPGNRNTGHEFGTQLTAEEKLDLLSFLQSL